MIALQNNMDGNPALLYIGWICIICKNKHVLASSYVYIDNKDVHIIFFLHCKIKYYRQSFTFSLIN